MLLARPAPVTWWGASNGEWSFVPMMVPPSLESLFGPDVDVAEPYDRTPGP